MPTLPAYVSTPHEELHRARREQLLDARDFRLEQTAAFERDLADAPQHSVVRALHAAANTALAEIDGALDRMARGTYGRCVTCSRPIPDDRLDVLPMAPRCMPCHYKVERQPNPGRRHDRPRGAAMWVNATEVSVHRG